MKKCDRCGETEGVCFAQVEWKTADDSKSLLLCDNCEGFLAIFLQEFMDGSEYEEDWGEPVTIRS